MSALSSPPTRRSAATIAVVVGVCLAALVPLGCGDNSRTAVLPDDSRLNVMVIDDGIDPSLPALQAGLAGAFTVVCDRAATGGDDNRSPTDIVSPDPGEGGAVDFDALKREMIAALAVPDESCHLRGGIDGKAPFGQTIEDKRLRWNRALQNDDDPFTNELAPVIELMDQYLEGGDYHGTSTAATAVFDIARLRLFLVEQPLRTMEEAADEVGCVQQQAIDTAVALLSDPEVREAFLDRPPAAIDRELAALRSTERIGLVNESFGSMSRHGLEEVLIAGGCPLVQLHAYFQILSDLLWAFDRRHAETDVLFLRAAGNEAAVLNDGDDGLQCRPGDVQQVLVGAYGFAGERSSFTNFGDCVDLYAPGEFIVSSIPGDWLALLSGTSFATPLTLRRVLFVAPEPFSPATARAALLDDRQPGGNLDVSLFRPEQVLDLRVIARKRQGALSAAAPVGEGMLSAAAAHRPARWPTPALRRVIEPLVWANRARARHASR